MFGWFKKKEVVAEAPQEKKKPEYVDVGRGWMFLYTGEKDLAHGTPEVLEGFVYDGVVLPTGELIHANLILQAQFQQQAAIGYFKLKDGSFVSKDRIKTIQFAADSLILEKGKKDEEDSDSAQSSAGN